MLGVVKTVNNNKEIVPLTGDVGNSLVAQAEAYTDAKNSYSTTEMLTGGTWIDGKPIYRKVVSGLSVYLSADVFTTVTQIENVATIVNARFIDNSGNLRFPTVTSKSGSNIQFYYGTYATIVSTVILEYTKTTD